MTGVQTCALPISVANKAQTEYPDQFGGMVRVGGVDVAEQVYFNLEGSSTAQSSSTEQSGDIASSYGE